MPRVHKKFYCMADSRPLKIQAFKQPHSSCGLDNYNVIDPRSKASTNSSMNSHSTQKQPCRMTSGSAETDLFLHSNVLTRGQWILHLRPCSNIHYTTSEFKYVVNRRGEAESINCIFKLASGVIILSRAAKPKKKRKRRALFTASSEPWFMKSIITICGLNFKLTDDQL